jgi:putative CocE/NonD family hydrolase
MIRPILAALRLVTVFNIAVLVTSQASPGQGVEYVTEHYTKYEYRIPMRDGVKLFTSVYVPKDTTTTHPIIMNRTPYSVGPYGIDQYRNNIGPSALFGKAGYIGAYQDVRGCYLSEGEFVDVRPQIPKKTGPKDIDESSDTYDTIEWLVKNVPNNNGKVGVWGISYPGFYAAAAMIDAHPALKAASPQAPLVDWFIGDDVHHNGAFFLHQSFNFDAVFGLPRPEPTAKSHPKFEHGTPDAYAFFLNLGPLARAEELYFKGQRAFWKDEMAHSNYDEFWKARALWPHFKNIKPAVLTVGGWFDAEDLYGPLKTHATVEKNHPQSDNVLVMGPWTHGGWSRGDAESLGPVKFASKTGEFFREHIEFPFFEFHLNGKSGWSAPKAWVFETGKNEWHRHDVWPPSQAKVKSLYFLADGKLGFEPPVKSDSDGFDEYLSDPSKPVPYTNSVSVDYPREFMIEDQRFASRRPDVLVYQTDVLKEDVTIAGPIQVKLQASTSGTDSDWVVKLIDVYPNDQPDPIPNPTGVHLGGFQQLVRGDVMRGKFRNSLETPEAFKPGEPTEIPIAIPDTYHTFRPGHRIMVQVQSSWFPLVDRNPQTFVDIYKAKESDFRKATQRVFRTSDRASRIELLVKP